MNLLRTLQAGSLNNSHLIAQGKTKVLLCGFLRTPLIAKIASSSQNWSFLSIL